MGQKNRTIIFGKIGERILAVTSIIGFIMSIVFPLISIVLPVNNAILALASLMVASLAVIIHNQRIHTEQLDEYLTSNIITRTVRSEDEFFNLLEAGVLAAESRVDLTYFDNRPPVESRTVRGQEYHSRLWNIVKQKATVHFRRIVRGNPYIISWIEESIENMVGQLNFSLACYPDNEPERPNLDIITVQLIDGNTTYLVSIGTQQPTRAPRDIVINSPQINEMWSRYYDNLWAKSTVILNRGTLQTDEWAEIRSHRQIQKSQR